jgi:hypothetical protein
MGNSLAVTFVLAWSGVVTGGVESERAELAGVPVLHSFAAEETSFIDDVEAVACWANKGAYAASDTAEGVFLPEVVIEVIVEPGSDVSEFKFFAEFINDILEGGIFIRLAVGKMFGVFVCEGVAFFGDYFGEVFVIADGS